jgi:SAM-dependent methyltransferase
VNPIRYVPYPPTSFPFRDLLVLERLELNARDRVCEIGVGSGATATRLAQLCAAVTGFDVSAPAIAALGDLRHRHPNLELVAADVTVAEHVAPYAGRFDRVVSCDTLEHVEDAAAFFRAIAHLLAPGGTFFVTFPNEPPGEMHGVTRFESVEQLAALLEAAGLASCRIGAATLAPPARWVADHLARRPRRVVRRLLNRRSGPFRRPDHVRSFEETAFFRRRRLWQRLSPAVNLYWWGVLRAMTALGPAFDVDWGFDRTPFANAQLLVTGQRPRAAPAVGSLPA